MAQQADVRARQQRQARAASIVWGLLFVVVGTLLQLDNLRQIDLGSGWQFPPPNAVDGNEGTRWSSTFSDPQWIAIDLGAPAEITRVRLHWEKAYATDYRIETSDDGSSWTTAQEVTDGKGGLDEHALDARGRYLRIYTTRRATPWGVSLWELEVIGTMGGPEPELLSRGKPATASSTETDYSLAWLLFWPVLLIGGGLPLVLAPKDEGEQVLGLFMTGVGVFFQLQKLGLVTWGIARVWPLLLIGAGLLLVVQAVRQAHAADHTRPGDGAGPFEGGR
jgi:hypothetical protein